MIYNNIFVSGNGVYLPPLSVPNNHLPVVTEETCAWVEKNLGIKSRRFASPQIGVVSMGVYASVEAMHDAGVAPDNIDCVIVSCSSPSHFAPSISNQIIRELGVVAPAFDINAVCSGFIYAMDLGCKAFSDDNINNVLIVATEAYSAITNFLDRDSVYFGDGAGAVVLSRGQGRISVNLYADGQSDSAFVVKAGGLYSMNGKMVYERATSTLPSMVEIALHEANIKISNIDYMVPHQAGIRVIRKLAETIGIQMDKVITVVDKYANIASASIPIALYEIDHTKKTVLMVSIGSGWTYGTAIIQP